MEGGLAMKKSKFTEQQIAFALKQAETGTKVKQIVRKLGITEQTFYRWKRRYGGLAPSELKKMRLLEDENRKLKHMVADLSLDNAMLQEVIEKNSKAFPEARPDGVSGDELPCQRAPGLSRASLSPLGSPLPLGSQGPGGASPAHPGHRSGAGSVRLPADSHSASSGGL